MVDGALGCHPALVPLPIPRHIRDDSSPLSLLPVHTSLPYEGRAPWSRTSLPPVAATHCCTGCGQTLP
eukprot:10413827-Prorocentrum_lima.AAC.1